MSQILHLQIPDPLFKAIEREATAQNSDPASIATAALQERFPSLSQPENSAQVQGCLEQLFGAETEAPVTGLDNDAIDTDLAKEYARGLSD